MTRTSFAKVSAPQCCKKNLSRRDTVVDGLVNKRYYNNHDRTDHNLFKKAVHRNALVLLFIHLRWCFIMPYWICRYINCGGNWQLIK